MKMNNLRLLRESMLKLGAVLQQFAFQINNAAFDCLFVANQKPHLLCITVRGRHPLYLRFEVNPETFEIANYIPDENYKLLAKALGTDGSSGNKLIPIEFLKGLDAKIPTSAKHRVVPATEVVRLRPDITENRDRPYFDTWVYWKKGSSTQENRAKTLALIGESALRHSIDFACSSKWSSIDTGREWNANLRKK